MHDQADQLRKLVRATVEVDAALAPGGPVIAVSGGQAGVGVTTITRQLARELARLGKQVVLIDANLQGAAQQVVSRNGASNAYRSADNAWLELRTIAEVLSGARRAVEILSPLEDEGVRHIAGCPADCAPQLDREAVARFAAEVAALSRQFDIILIDAGYGMNAWIDRLWQLAGQVLLAATPDSTALLDAYAAVKLSQFQRLDDKLRLLINRSHRESESVGLGQRFNDTCQRFLSISAKPPIALPDASRRKASSGSGAVAAGLDDAFQRAVRLLAADLTCDFRVASLRLLQPKQAFASAGAPLAGNEQKKTPNH
jgi:MinD-like ATPase involved in chromosome partitioning or flagellar assembly